MYMSTQIIIGKILELEISTKIEQIFSNCIGIFETMIDYWIHQNLVCYQLYLFFPSAAKTVQLKKPYFLNKNFPTCDHSN